MKILERIKGRVHRRYYKVLVDDLEADYFLKILEKHGVDFFIAERDFYGRGSVITYLSTKKQQKNVMTDVSIFNITISKV